MNKLFPQYEYGGPLIIIFKFLSPSLIFKYNINCVCKPFNWTINNHVLKNKQIKIRKFNKNALWLIKLNYIKVDNDLFKYSSRNGHIKIVKLLLKDKRIDSSDGDKLCITYKPKQEIGIKSKIESIYIQMDVNNKILTEIYNTE